MTKKHIKKTVAICLSAALLLGGATAFAMPTYTEPSSDDTSAAAERSSSSEDTSISENPAGKEEVIYGNLSCDGSVQKLYAVNIFHASDIADYGAYSEVRNLTTDDKLTLKNGKVTASVSETPFYYEGIMKSKQLPWDINIAYTLDGKSISADNLGGKSGDLEIRLNISEASGTNTKQEAANNAAHTNSDTAHASSLDDMDFFYENYALQITLTLDSYYCRNITAEGATIANVGSDKQITYTIFPGKGCDLLVSADVTDFEMESVSINGIKLDMDLDIDASELTDEAQRLENGVSSLDDGAADLKEGTSSIDEAAASMENGAAQLYESAALLNIETAKLAAAVTGAAYKALMKENGMDIDGLLSGNQQALEQLNSALAQPSLPQEQAALYQQLYSLLQGNTAAISGAISYLDGVNQNLTDLSTATDDLKSGISNLKSGASDLKSGSNALKSGAVELKSGTSTLKKETAGIDTRIAEKIENVTEGITGSDEVRSFLSEKNTDIKSVQFVLKTEPIEKAAS